MIERKLKELELFNGYKINILDKEIIFFVKPISLTKKRYILNNLKELIKTDDDYKTLLNDLIDINQEDLNFVLSNEQANEILFEKIFKEQDVNANFEELVIDRLEKATQANKELINLFISFLISYGYKLIELESLSHLEIVDLCIKESLMRNKDLFIETILEECKSLDNKSIRYPRLYDYVTQNYKVNNKTKNKQKSDFDLLAEL